ncbi:MAG: hypothetical protein MJK10_02750 [Pseudomonadales bacterium]|nr:hypothetical protein [Pseudomonadales bacterium]NRA14786.1 hypothetical protein [Oceanospirillaceae bacterium]
MNLKHLTDLFFGVLIQNIKVQVSPASSSFLLNGTKLPRPAHAPYLRPVSKRNGTKALLAIHGTA